MPGWWKNIWVWRARVLILTGILLAVVAWQPYDVVGEALPYVGFLSALIIFWRMRQRRRVTG
jgi:hypothetical protein